MDSLLASYASDDDDDGGSGSATTSVAVKTEGSAAGGGRSALFSSLPPPKSLSAGKSGERSSMFASLPKPRAELGSSGERSSMFASLPKPIMEAGNSGGRSSMFASLPAPRMEDTYAISNPLSLESKPGYKAVMTPSNLYTGMGSSLDEDGGNVDPVVPKGNNQASKSSKTSLVLPAPKNMLGMGNSSSRKSSLDANVPAAASVLLPSEPEADTSDAVEDYPSSTGDGIVYCDPASSFVQSNECYGVGYENYGAEGYYTGYEGGYSDGSVVAPTIPDAEMAGGKRKRNNAPPEIVEVNQSELMKDRPRQDTSSLTGLTYGPAYQSTSSAKGKPSKLHKRKHQIGSLYFDMKQKERELAERRANGMRTKAETQGKYGW